MRALVLGQGTKASSGKAYPKLLVRTLMSHKLTTSTRKRKKILFANLLVEPNLQRYRVSQKELPFWKFARKKNPLDILGPVCTSSWSWVVQMVLIGPKWS